MLEQLLAAHPGLAWNPYCLAFPRSSKMSPIMRLCGLISWTDREELFRRVVFNALISNLDDHPRNHALIAPEREWQLAPAYDLTPQPSASLEQRNLALECGPLGRMARRDNLLAGAGRFGLEKGAAAAIIDGLRQVVAQRWRGEVLRHGGTEGDCATAIEPSSSAAFNRVIRIVKMEKPLSREAQ